MSMNGLPQLILGYGLITAFGLFLVPVQAGELSGFDCLIEPYAVSDLGTREVGVLQEFKVKRGDIVKKDQVLALLESSVEEIAVELAQARAKMSGSIAGKVAKVKYLARQKARIDKLYTEKAVPFTQKDQAGTDWLLAKTELRDARETMQLLGIELRRAKQAMSRRTIRSPSDGVVVKLLQAPGESVENRPIMTIAQVDPLNVEVILNVELMGKVVVGTQATVKPIYPGGGSYDARVTLIDRVVDAASNTFGVRLELSNSDYLIPGGVRCDIRFLDVHD